MFFDNEEEEVEEIFIKLEEVVEEEVFTEEGEVDEEVGSTDKEVQDIFIELDNIDLDNILFVFFQVSVW